MKKTICEKTEVTDQNEVVIDVSIKTVEELYNNPGRNASDIPKELNEEFVDCIIDRAGEISESEFIIRITLPKMPDEKAMNCVQNSIETKFHNLKDLENQSIDKMLSRSFKLFGLGLFLLFIAIVFNRYFSLSEWTLTRIFYEGITIAALLSLWAAIVSLIIKWPPHTKNIKLYERIMKIQVIFHYESPGRLGLQAPITQESSIRLSKLGGTEKKLKPIPRKRNRGK
jgi:hypothetical protein